MAIEFFRNELMNKMFIPVVAAGTVATATVAVVVINSNDNNGKLSDFQLNSYNALDDSVSSFTNDNGVYVDASGDLIFNENLLDKTLEQLEDEGFFIPEGWDRLFDFKRPVFTESDGEYYINLWWEDGSEVFDGDVNVSEIDNGLLEYINQDDFDMDFTYTVPSNDLDFSDFNYTEDEFIDLVNDIMSHAGIYYIDDGNYSFLTANIRNNYDNGFNFQLYYSSIFGSVPEEIEEVFYTDRSYLSTDGTYYYLQIYWADGTEVFAEGIKINDNTIKTEDDIMNIMKDSIVDSSRFKS